MCLNKAEILERARVEWVTPSNIKCVIQKLSTNNIIPFINIKNKYAISMQMINQSKLHDFQWCLMFIIKIYTSIRQFNIKLHLDSMGTHSVGYIALSLWLYHHPTAKTWVLRQLCRRWQFSCWCHRTVTIQSMFVIF